jgi:hypothetical protein
VHFSFEALVLDRTPNIKPKGPAVGQVADAAGGARGG